MGELVNDLDPTLYVLLGIAAFLGAGYRVPLAAVMFVAETTAAATRRLLYTRGCWLYGETGDVVATVFHSLGFKLEDHLPGPAGRPFPLVDFGKSEIKELF